MAMITRKQLQQQLEQKEKEIKKKDKQILLLEVMINNFKKGIEEVIEFMKEEEQKSFEKTLPKDEL